MARQMFSPRLRDRDRRSGEVPSVRLSPILVPAIAIVPSSSPRTAHAGRICAGSPSSRLWWDVS